jgi:outer membrane immunogenic protein
MYRSLMLLLVSALGVGAAQNSMAADMPLKAPAAVVAQNWTGCYLGASAGLVRGISKQTYGGDRAGVPDAFLPVGYDITGDYNLVGALGGVGAGCNYQTANWVWGVEVDGAVTNASGQANPTLGAIIAGANPLRVFHTDQRWLATARARLGYAVDKSLWYVTGGVAFTRMDVNNDACAVASNACRNPDRVTRTGWVVGAGVEYALAPSWSLKTEVLYADFGTFHYNDSPAVNGCVQCYSMDVKASELIGRVGLNLRL